MASASPPPSTPRRVRVLGRHRTGKTVADLVPRCFRRQGHYSTAPRPCRTSCFHRDLPTCARRAGRAGDGGAAQGRANYVALPTGAQRAEGRLPYRDSVATCQKILPSPTDQSRRPQRISRRAREDSAGLVLLCPLPARQLPLACNCPTTLRLSSSWRRGASAGGLSIFGDHHCFSPTSCCATRLSARLPACCLIL